MKPPCNGDFIEAAEAVARFIDLPLYWMDIELDHLESVLADAIQRRLAGDAITLFRIDGICRSALFIW